MQVYLAQGLFAKVVGRSEGLLAVCGAMHYGLVALSVRVQTAAAYAMLGKETEARALLRQTIGDAEPDGLIMPFAENYGYIGALLERLAREAPSPFLAAVVRCGTDFSARCAARRQQARRPAALAALTDRECAVVELIAQRRSNRDIAEQLFLSEGSVKQYLNQIYAKLHIEGDTRTKRRRLAELADS